MLLWHNSWGHRTVLPGVTYQSSLSSCTRAYLEEKLSEVNTIFFICYTSHDVLESHTDWSPGRPIDQVQVTLPICQVQVTLPIDQVQEEGAWGEAIPLALVDNLGQRASGEAGEDAR